MYDAEGHVSAATIREARAELDALYALENAVATLNEIVEGVRSVLWQAPHGGRLKDAPEWCALYCALASLKRTASPNIAYQPPEGEARRLAVDAG